MPHLPTSRSAAVTPSVSDSMNLTILDTLRKWTHAACGLLRLVPYTQYNTFVSQLRVSGPFFIVAE